MRVLASCRHQHITSDIVSRFARALSRKERRLRGDPKMGMVHVSPCAQVPVAAVRRQDAVVSSGF